MTATRATASSTQWSRPPPHPSQQSRGSRRPFRSRAVPCHLHGSSRLPPLPVPRSTGEQNTASFTQKSTTAADGKLRGLKIEELKERLFRGISDTDWFITGNVDSRLFSEDFSFKDPQVKTAGIDTYSNAVARLFDPATQMDIVSTEITGEREIKMVWRLEATIRVPFKPKIKAYYVTTYFRTDGEGLINEQEEFFSVPEWELFLSIFFPNIGTPPAPPVQK